MGRKRRFNLSWFQRQKRKRLIGGTFSQCMLGVRAEHSTCVQTIRVQHPRLARSSAQLTVGTRRSGFGPGRLRAPQLTPLGCDFPDIGAVHAGSPAKLITPRSLKRQVPKWARRSEKIAKGGIQPPLPFGSQLRTAATSLKGPLASSRRNRRQVTSGGLLRQKRQTCAWREGLNLACAFCKPRLPATRPW